MFKGMIDRLKIEVFLAAAFGSQVNLWVGYFTAWGKLDWLFPAATQSMVATVITGFLSTVLSALLMIAFVRVYRLLNYLAQKAEEAQKEIEAGQHPTSVIRGVVLTEKAAQDFESPKIVGPSEAKTL